MELSSENYTRLVSRQRLLRSLLDKHISLKNSSVSYRKIKQEHDTIKRTIADAHRSRFNNASTR